MVSEGRRRCYLPHLRCPNFLKMVTRQRAKGGGRHFLLPAGFDTQACATNFKMDISRETA